MGTAQSPFSLNLTDNALEDLRYLRKAERTWVMDSIEEQLTGEPLTPTRNRKPLRANDLAMWQIRVGANRVFYDVDEVQRVVVVKAVGWKEHNKLYIRGKEYEL